MALDSKVDGDEKDFAFIKTDEPLKEVKYLTLEEALSQYARFGESLGDLIQRVNVQKPKIEKDKVIINLSYKPVPGMQYEDFLIYSESKEDERVPEKFNTLLRARESSVIMKCVPNYQIGHIVKITGVSFNYNEIKSSSGKRGNKREKRDSKR